MENALSPSQHPARRMLQSRGGPPPPHLSPSQPPPPPGDAGATRNGTGTGMTPLTPAPTTMTGIPCHPPLQTPSHPETPRPEEPAAARRNADEKVASRGGEGKAADLPPHLDISGPPKCSGCGRQIADRYLNHVLGAFWHAACLVCTECRLPLQKSCFQNEGNLYCGIHFFRRFGTRCRGCGEGIPPSEMVRRAHENVYHLACFTCAVCGQQLDTGDHFYLRTDHSLVCRADYERSRQSCSSGMDEDEDEGNQPSTKRPRASINNKQLEELKNAYNVSRKPSRSLREELGKKLGLDVRVVQVWFQNRRAKEKRLKREVVPSSPFGTHQEPFPVPVSGIDDGDRHQSQAFHIPGKHAMQLPVQDGNQTDFYSKHDGPSAGTEATSGVTIPNHPSPGCCPGVAPNNNNNNSHQPGTQNSAWSCHPYLDCPPGQRDAFSSPPHHNQYLQGGPGGGGAVRAAEEPASSSFSRTAVHGAVVCTSEVTPPPGGQSLNYEQGSDKGWGLQTNQSGFTENPMNGSYHFHNL